MGFFQRVLDGDAFNIIIRKAVAATASILSPLGMGSLLVGVIVWILLFRRLLPTLTTEFTTLHMVAVAALAVAILGTALNDGGITIWYTLTSAFTVTVAALWIDRSSGLHRKEDQIFDQNCAVTLQIEAPQCLESLACHCQIKATTTAPIPRGCVGGN